MSDLFLLCEYLMARISSYFALSQVVKGVVNRRGIGGMVYVIKHRLNGKLPPVGEGGIKPSISLSHAR